MAVCVSVTDSNAYAAVPGTSANVENLATTRSNKVHIVRLDAGVSASSDTVTYPHQRKFRGRPKCTGKSLN